jgi:poly-beta-1,6-N-acetyl-D-glucosamine synthase
MSASGYIFWVSLVILFYCYFGYGLIIFLLNNIRVLFQGKKKQVPPVMMPVTLIVSAYNEAAIIRKKIINTLAIDYPKEKLEIIFITDGSSDETPELVSSNASIRLLHLPERRGKYAAIKRAMREVKTPIVIFSDANSMLNTECIKRIVSHYADPKVGGVAGEKKILQNNYISAVGEAEGLYWQYESFMKKQDAELYTVVGAAGELFSIRTSLFKESDDNLVLDDFVISMQVCLQGFKIRYEPDAFATELPSASLREEEKRKVRISAGAYQSIGILKGCLNFFKYPLLAFQFISRRLLRWVFCPVLLFTLLFSNIVLIMAQGYNYFYEVTLMAQVFFYFFAILGWLFIKAGKRAGLFTIPFYFVFMNYCLIKGFARFLQGKQSVLWEKSLRQAAEA